MMKYQAIICLLVCLALSTYARDHGQRRKREEEFSSSTSTARNNDADFVTISANEAADDSVVAATYEKAIEVHDASENAEGSGAGVQDIDGILVNGNPEAGVASSDNDQTSDSITTEISQEAGESHEQIDSTDDPRLFGIFHQHGGGHGNNNKPSNSHGFPLIGGFLNRLKPNRTSGSLLPGFNIFHRRSAGIDTNDTDTSEQDSIKME